MREFFATLVALIIILIPVVAFFFGLSFLVTSLESFGVSGYLAYFLCGILIGVHRKRIISTFTEFCSRTWAWVVERML